MTIRTKLFGVIATLCAIFCVGMYLSVKHLVDELVQELLWKYSEVTTQYDSEKALADLSSQIDIARELAQNPHVLAWAQDANNGAKQQAAAEWLMRQRQRFLEDNYYIALNENLAFYMSSKDDTKSQPYLRFYLSPNNSEQSWYFSQRSNRKLFGATVDYDDDLGVVKLWLSEPIIHDGEFLGMIGTSLDLGPLVPKLVNKLFPGLETVFINTLGEIELDHSFISGDFVHHLKRFRNKPSMHRIIPDLGSYDAVMEAMRRQSDGQEANMLVVPLEPSGNFVSLRYLNKLGWYQMKLVNIDEVLDGGYLKSFTEISVVMFILFTFLVFVFISRRFYFPMVDIYRQLKCMLPDGQIEQSGDMAIEINKHLESLDRELFRSRHSLDSLVRERTETLDQLAMLDPLTGLLNRSGMERELNAELARAKREKGAFGLVWLSIDGMSQVETMDIDSHLEQDKRLRFASSVLKQVVREYDCACRWADDEFVILIRSNSVKALEALTARLKAETCRDNRLFDLSFALGGLIVEPPMSVQDALAKADGALYLAKTKASERIHIIPASGFRRLRA